MSAFDLGEFEQQVHALLADHQRLQKDYAALRAAHDDQARRNREIRDELTHVIERIRALEAGTGNV